MDSKFSFAETTVYWVFVPSWYNFNLDQSSMLVPEFFFWFPMKKKKLCQNFKICVFCDIQYLAIFIWFCTYVIIVIVIIVAIK